VLLLMELMEYPQETIVEDIPNPDYREDSLALPSLNPKRLIDYVPDWSGPIVMMVEIFDEQSRIRRWEYATRDILSELEKNPKNESFVLDHLRSYVENVERKAQNSKTKSSS